MLCLELFWYADYKQILFSISSILRSWSLVLQLSVAQSSSKSLAQMALIQFQALLCFFNQLMTPKIHMIWKSGFTQSHMDQQLCPLAFLFAQNTAFLISLFLLKSRAPNSDRILFSSSLSAFLQSIKQSKGLIFRHGTCKLLLCPQSGKRKQVKF